MVSKARDDLPLPESPVTTTITSRGKETVISFRLCSRAPRTTIWLSVISVHPTFSARLWQVYGPLLGAQRSSSLLDKILPSERPTSVNRFAISGPGSQNNTRRLHHVANGACSDLEGLLPHPSRRIGGGLPAPRRRDQTRARPRGRRTDQRLDLPGRSGFNRPGNPRRGLLEGRSLRRLPSHHLSLGGRGAARNRRAGRRARARPIPARPGRSSQAPFRGLLPG